MQKELLPGTYSFLMVFAATQQQVSQNITSNPVVVFQTKGVTVQLRDSAGNPLDTGTVQYYGSGWLNFGQTSGGQVAKELLSGIYMFTMTYNSTTQQLSQNVASNPVVVFQTKGVTVQLKDSAGNPLDTGAVQYYAGGWLGFGQTSGGQVLKELLPGTYSFLMTYSATQQQLSQNITANPVVVFQTKGVTVQLKDGAGTPLELDTGTVRYYFGGWLSFGQTSAGQVRKELLPGSYAFDIVYGPTTQQASQDIGLAQTVFFQTGKVHSASNSCTGYYFHGWQAFSNEMEILPGQYTFRFDDGTGPALYTVVAGTPVTIH